MRGTAKPEAEAEADKGNLSGKVVNGMKLVLIEHDYHGGGHKYCNI